MLTKEKVLGFALDAGFHKSGITGTDGMEKVVSCGQYHAEGNGSFLISALSCYRDEPADLSKQDNPHGLIAPFARRNYYGEAVGRMKEVFRRIMEKTGLRKRDGRIFCNSRLPEKPLALLSGLGFYGKNSLIVSPGLGSLFVIAGLYIPVKLEPDLIPPEWKEPGSICGNCTACMDACPVGAIVRPGILEESKCLQYKASRYMSFSDDEKTAWGSKLYGCQVCQDVCPHNENLKYDTKTSMGDIGPSISLKKILSINLKEIKKMFKDTQMGLSWVSARAIVRNAVIASGNRKEPAMLPYLGEYTGSDDGVLRESAKWAMDKIRE